MTQNKEKVQKKKQIKKTMKKRDFIPLSLFQMMRSHWEEMESFRKKLTKYIDDNYKMKSTCQSYASGLGDKQPYPSDEAWEDFVSNMLWEDELSSGDFDKELKKQSIKK